MPPMLVARLLRLLLYLALVLSLGTGYTAVPQTEQAGSLPELQISAGEWPPFLSEHLPHQGVVAHLIRDIFAAAGYKVSFSFLPWARAYHDSANGKYAASAVWMLAEERTKDFLYSEPVLSEQFVFFHLKQRRFDWQQLTDLRGLLLGGGLGYSYGPAFDQALEDKVFKMSRVGSTEQNFRRLAAGRIDVFAEEMSVGYYTLNHQLPQLAAEISHHPRPLLINQSFLLFPQNAAGSARLLQLFNQHLQQFKQSGRYQSYFDRLAEGGYQ
ncbi:transporter substrate-binding domain-containing protein [Rheinheimera muenzenbergensis]|uniref:Transporter substrate-binding domain-containing protein n=1 Tax=Rheinheimera muenzenbergensis TaxID=1193628 RepID=A0ABU8C8Z7_9GAMM